MTMIDNSLRIDHRKLFTVDYFEGRNELQMYGPVFIRAIRYSLIQLLNVRNIVS